MATLHVGGDDIDFPGILLNCILESHVPGGPPTRTCDDQRDHSWSLIKSDNLWKNFGNLIGKIVDKGRKGPVGDKFRLYVIGYGQFFNDKTTACDNVTFARTANPKDDGKKHTMITTNLRQDFNKMSLALNDAISRAVGDYKDKGVTFLDIDHFLEGHRFCEEGINEPDQNNEKLYFFHYPYKQNDKAAAPTNQSNFDDIVNAANEKVFGNSSTADLSKKYVNAKAVDDAFYDALDYGAIEKVTEGNVSAFWGYFIGDRAKVFHPQEVFHDRIEWMIYDRYKEDGGVEGI